MRLINVRTVKLEEFFEQEIPPYAILSHRWGPEELTYKEVAKNRINKNKRGYNKLVQACRAVTRYDLGYLWIDTACIDKRSSAELSEAINSMFQWYRDSRICIAYMEDVVSGPRLKRLFEESVWFTRSWTLQELIAPISVHFFDTRWTYIGDRNSTSGWVESVTGISKSILRGERSMWSSLIAERMFWASKRVATRPEDEAYSLMGIFNVNMPPLYGEGKKAFARLQEEIIKQTTDSTFLHWMPEPWKLIEYTGVALIAGSPRDFARPLGPAERAAVLPFTLTNTILETEGFVIRCGPHVYALRLAYSLGEGRAHMGRSLLVRRTAGPHHYGTMYKIGIRESTPGFNDLTHQRWSKLRLLRLPGQLVVQPWPERLFENFGFDIIWGEDVVLDPLVIEYGDVSPLCSKSWDVVPHGRRIFWDIEDPTRITTATMKCIIQNSVELFVSLSFDFESRPCALITGHRSHQSVWDISDSVTQDHRVPNMPRHKRETYGLEVELIDVRSVVGSAEPVYLLRSSTFTTVTAQLPYHFLSSNRTARIALVEPPPAVGAGERFERWRFILDNNDPILGSELYVKC